MKVLLTLEKVVGEMDGASLVTVVRSPSIFEATLSAERDGWKVLDAEQIFAPEEDG